MSKRVHPRVKRTLAYWARHQRLKCGCMGYHFPHRKKGGACIYSPRADYYAALNAGRPLSEAMEFLSAADLERMFPVSA
jgi:hypothetical protein